MEYTDIEIAIIKQKLVALDKKRAAERECNPIHRTLMEGYIEALEWVFHKVREIETSKNLGK